MALEKKFFKFRQHIFTISWLSPLGKGQGLHLNKVESPSPRDTFCQVWLKLAQEFWRRRFLKVVNFFFIIFQLSPLWEGRGPSFEQTWIPFTQGYFVPNLVEIGPVVLEKKMKNVKSLQTDRQTDRRTDGQTTDDRYSEKLTWAFTPMTKKQWPLVLCFVHELKCTMSYGSQK